MLTGDAVVYTLMRTVFVMKVAVDRNGSAQILQAKQHEMIQTFLLHA